MQVAGEKEELDSITSMNTPPLRAEEMLAVKNRYFISLHQGRPEFSTPGADAIEAYDHHRTPFLALLCRPEAAVRWRLLEKITAITHHGFLPLCDYDMVTLPGQRGRRLALIYQAPYGPRLALPGAVSFPHFSENQALRCMLGSLLPALKELAEQGIAHRGIRPDNLFWSDNQGKKLILGDAVSCSAGLLQPSWTESLSYSSANPLARGEGDPSDDVFALGATLLALILGEPPLNHLPEEERLSRRLQEGSFLAYTSQRPISKAVLDLLRGMLTDDPKERYSIEEVEAWIHGKRRLTRQPAIHRRAVQAFSFVNQNHFYARNLALALSQNWGQAAAALKSHAFDNWVRRWLGNLALAEELAKAAKGQASGERGSFDDRLIAKSCILLDPHAPLRVPGFSASLDGLGNALANGLNDQDILNGVAMILSCHLPSLWLRYNPESPLYAEIKKFESLPLMLHEPSPGFGIERCLYELNPFMACQSPLVKDFYVKERTEILPALERAASLPGRGSMPIDRHLAAFIGSKYTEIKDSDLKPLGSGDENKKRLAVLRLLAKAQKYDHGPPAPKLAAWLVDVAAPILSSYRNLPRRRRLQAKAAEAALSGNLYELLGVIDNAEEQLADETGFHQAAVEHRIIAMKIRELENIRDRKSDFAVIRGEQITLSLATLASMAGVLMIFVMRLL